jgi:uncharacterized membrane protein
LHGCGNRSTEYLALVDDLYTIMRVSFLLALILMVVAYISNERTYLATGTGASYAYSGFIEFAVEFCYHSELFL